MSPQYRTIRQALHESVWESTPEGFQGRLTASLVAYQTRARQVQRYFQVGLGVLLVVGLYTGAQAWGDMQTSGFSELLALIWSTPGVLLGYSEEVLYSLLETLPLVSTLGLISIVGLMAVVYQYSLYQSPVSFGSRAD